MQKLQSIEAIHKVFNTSGSYPVLVTCDDFQDWVCKYGVSSHLINEYLGASFAEIWGINTPPTSFVKIKPEHIPNEFALPKSKFAKYCFGSLYLKEAELINDSLTSLFRGSKLKNHLKNKEDILKIALFDMWLANEDRTPNNTNLLLYSKKADKSFDFYAIDHVAIFNSGNLRHGLFLLNEFDTILNADFVKILFRNEHNIEKSVRNVIENFYICVSNCENKLDEILESIPDNWQIELKETRQNLQFLFSNKWKAQCERRFREFIQLILIQKK